MQVAAKTDVGQVRSRNEDCYYVGALGSGAVLAVICDGMGGAAGGYVASQTTVQLVADAVRGAYQEQMGSRSLKHLLVTALDNANTRVFDMADADEALAGMGTTVVAAIAAPGMVCIAHAGDSRAYLSTGGALLQLTKDHSVVQAMVDNGQITEDEAKSHPRKNLITRALGVGETLEVDYCEEELSPGDVLLLCTDGLTNTVEAETIQALLGQGELQGAAERLVDEANRSGGTDNITVVLIGNES